MSAAVAVPIITIPEPAPAGAGTGIAEVLSPSQVFIWRNCQARWMYRYRRHLPDAGSASLALGTAVDRAIKATWHHKLDKGYDLPLEPILTVYAETWLAESAGVEFGPKEHKDEIARQGAVMIAKYLEQAEPKVHPAAVDLEVHGTIAGVDVRGYVDLVEIDGTTVDLKTGQRTPNALTTTQLLQLATYAQLARDVPINDNVRVDTLVRLKNPKLVQIEQRLTFADYAWLDSSYPMVQEQMRTGLYDANRDSFLCTRSKCGYWRQCEADYGGIVRGGESDE